MAKPTVLFLMLHGIGMLKEATIEEDIARFEEAMMTPKRRKLHGVEVVAKPVLWSRELNSIQHKLYDLLIGDIYEKWPRHKPREWRKYLRYFILVNIGDALSLENQSERVDSAYHKVQLSIREAIDEAYEDERIDEETPVVLMAQSLGAFILSNYLWDVQRHEVAMTHGGAKPRRGRAIQETDSAQMKRRYSLKNTKLLITTACNIPLFITGNSKILAIETQKLGYDIEWMNYFYGEDIFGWPMQPMGAFYDPDAPLGQSYETATTDVRVSPDSDSIAGWFINKTPLCHVHYWKDNDLLDTFAKLVHQRFYDE